MGAPGRPKCAPCETFALPVSGPGCTRAALEVFRVTAGWRGRGGCRSAGPDARSAPGSRPGEVDVDGYGAWSGEECGQALAQLRECGSEREQAGGDGRAGEGQGVALGVDAALEQRGFTAAQIEGRGGEQEAGVGVWRSGEG